MHCSPTSFDFHFRDDFFVDGKLNGAHDPHELVGFTFMLLLELNPQYSNFFTRPRFLDLSFSKNPFSPFIQILISVDSI